MPVLPFPANHKEEGMNVSRTALVFPMIEVVNARNVVGHCILDKTHSQGIGILTKLGFSYAGNRGDVTLT